MAYLKFYRYALLGLCIVLLITPTVAAQSSANAPCGVVDELDFPIQGLVPGYNDFGLYRADFGGNHTGLDIGFDRWGDPVYAAARGLVTYADPEGWGAEKGVVIIAITFPDGSVDYTVYGHMESDTIPFPTVGTCVNQGDAIGTIGWPAQERPHLHYEIRNFMPNDGGPGYVTDNPLDDGWYDPQDFTAVWRIRLTVPAYLSSIALKRPMTLPPVMLDNGEVVTASNNLVTATLPPDQVLWRIQADSTVTGLGALPGGITVIHTKSGQVSVLKDGRFQAVWNVVGPGEPFLMLDGNLIFLTNDGAIAAYDSAGTALWRSPGTAGANTLYFGLNSKQIAIALQQPNGALWRTLDENGQISAEIPLTFVPSAFAPSADGSWFMLADQQVVAIQGKSQQTVATLPAAPGHHPAILSDSAGHLYIYLNDTGNTLLSLDSKGQIRWQMTYPGQNSDRWSPLLAIGKSCLLYTLDADGLTHVISAVDGRPLNSLQLYPGGNRNGSPMARFLNVDDSEHVEVGAGFLSLVTLDGLRLGGVAAAKCS